MGGKRKIVGIGGPLFREHGDDLGDDIAAALHGDKVSYLEAEALNLVRVMKGCAADGGATDEDRLQGRHGRYLAGTSDLHEDVFYLSYAGAGGKFVGNGPTGSAPGKSHFPLEVGAIDFHYHAVNFVG